MVENYDVIVVGSGVVGACIARELGRYDLHALVLEAGLDIACGASRANSGIVHAGFDPIPGTLKAKYNVMGSRMFPQWSEELGFTFMRNGSMVVAYSPDEEPVLSELADRALENGVEGVRLLERDEVLETEPNVSIMAMGALLAPTGGICDPYDLTFAAAENAVANGVGFAFGQRVVGIERVAVPGTDADAGRSVYRVSTEAGETVCARAIVNAAGVHADDVNNMVSASRLDITPVRGEYLLFDAGSGLSFQRTMFQVPTALGKGVVVSTTVHGNLFVGPNAVPQQDKDRVATSEKGLDGIVRKARQTWPGLDMRDLITNFAGLRAKGSSGDFVIGEAPDAPGFFNAACIDSPGLTCAPAIAADLARDVAGYLGVGQKPDFDPHRAPTPRFALMTPEQRSAAIASDARWGHVVCRCCNVTEYELVHQLHGCLPVLSFDALKWRCGAAMGRCHAGFCTPEIIRIVARELGISPDEIQKRDSGSWMLSEARPDYAALAGCGRDGAAGSVEGCGAQGVAAGGDAVHDVVVIGAGAAGLAAAKAAVEGGAADVLVIDRMPSYGGILRQCIHSGFGLELLGEELTGPEYADRLFDDLAGLGVGFAFDTTVLQVGKAAEGGERPDGRGFVVEAASCRGRELIGARAVVLATGSRERSIGALNVAGDRPSGVYTAGTVQTFINLQGCIPGKRAVILGSGDVGLIMARRMALSGMEVVGVHEIMSTPSGLRRNVVQCLDDYGIPLRLSSTVVRLEGKGRLEAVWVCDVNPRTHRPLPGHETRIECDTLVLSVGLIPENELAKAAGIQMDPVTGGARVDDRFQTSMPGVFACGNALHIHDVADRASVEGYAAGRGAAAFARGNLRAEGREVTVCANEGVHYVVPQTMRVGAEEAAAETQTLSFRVTKQFDKPCIFLEAVGPRYYEILAKKRVPIAVPAEMLHIQVPTGMIGERCSGIRVNVAENEDDDERETAQDGAGTQAAGAQAPESQVAGNQATSCVCICCPRGCTVTAELGPDGKPAAYTGAGCARGRTYASSELVAPMRSLSAVACVPGVLEPLSVKTAAPIPKATVGEAARAIALMGEVGLPIERGQVVGTLPGDPAVSVVATKNLG